MINHNAIKIITIKMDNKQRKNKKENMPKENIQKNNNLISSIILVGYIIIYSSLTLIGLERWKDYWIDGITASLLCLFFLIINTKIPIHPFIAFLEGFIFVPNQIGYAFLYNLASINYHGDLIVHFVTSFVFVIIMMYYVSMIESIKNKKTITIVLALALTITGGTLVELSEYWGFYFFGFGESYLRFGVGDNSQNFGPWENTSMDHTFNFLGAFLGIACYFLFMKFYSNLPNKTSKNKDSEN